jgi:hypothetical protein
MRVFLDECVTKDIMPHLSGHAFVHISETPLRSTKNGALLRAVAPDYDVFLTTDKSIPYQQNLKKFPLAFVVMRPNSNDIADLLPLVPDLLATLAQIESGGFAPGDLHTIGAK